MNMHVLQSAPGFVSANPFAESTMLARLTIRQWSARRLDRKITNEVNAAHDAAHDAGRYNKLLLSKGALAELVAVAGRARDEHYKRTLPWQEDGARILTSAGYLGYAEAMRALRVEFEAAVAKFVDGYPAFVEDARQRLNGMFNESDYPAASQVARRFEFDTSILPFPSADDFRVSLATEHAATIRADIERRTQQAIADATRDVWQRIAEHVGKMSERLRAYKPGAGKGGRAEGVFRDSLVDNVRELVALLPSLNVTGDSILASVAARMADLCRDDADTLRDNATARESVADAADAILADVSDFLA